MTDQRHDAKIYVSFGPRDTQEVRLETAEKLLTSWAASNPAQFGRALAAVITADLQQDQQQATPAGDEQS